MTLAITRAHVVPIESAPFEGTVLVEDGRIAALGEDVTVPEDATVVDADGAWLLPGLIDAHVHLGVHEEGEGTEGGDTNERTDSVTSGVRAIDAINPWDRGFDDALAAGVTTVNVNPGSANPIGGQAVALHTFGRIVDRMVLRAPSGMKSALGENPKRSDPRKPKHPSTRLGTARIIREALTAARNWMDEGRPQRDIDLEPLADVLDGKIPWRQHSHRADDIATALRLADEFGYRLVIDHGTEAHLLADVLAEREIPVLIGPLMTSRSKPELRGRSVANPGKLAAAGVRISLITDHPVVPIGFLTLQAALAVKEGLDRDTALAALTLNPATVLGLEDRIGSLRQGKDADLVLFSGDPLELGTRVRRVWIGGHQVASDQTGELVLADRLTGA